MVDSNLIDEAEKWMTQLPEKELNYLLEYVNYHGPEQFPGFVRGIQMTRRYNAPTLNTDAKAELASIIDYMDATRQDGEWIMRMARGVTRLEKLLAKVEMANG